jgi:hypothetical protein
MRSNLGYLGNGNVLRVALVPNRLGTAVQYLSAMTSNVQYLMNGYMDDSMPK